MEKKTNKGLIGFIIVLVLLVFGMSGYIFYDKVLSKPKAEEKKENAKTTEEIKNVDFTNVNDKIGCIFSYITMIGKYDFQTDSEARLRFTEWVLYYKDDSLGDKVDVVKSDDTFKGQSFYYIKKDDFKKVYNQIFGEKYNFEDDYSKNKSTCSSNCINLMDFDENVKKYLKDGAYIAWLGEVGASPDYYVPTANKLIKNGNDYVLSGTYKVNSTEEEGKTLSQGEFKITYEKVENHNVLKTIELDK